MRLGVATDTVCYKLGYREGLTRIRQAGFESVDFSFCGEHNAKNLLGEDYIAQAHAIRAILDETGLVCGQAHAPFDFEFCDEMKPEDPVFRNILRSIEAAAILGAPYIVVHPVLSPIYVDMLEYNLRFYRTLAPYSEKFGVKIAIENIFDREPSQRCMGRYIVNRFEALRK